MEMRQLRYFLEVARLEHVTRAAATLHVTQSTLSHQLRQLEEELGTPLFDRVGRQIQLTQAGRLFAKFAARALRDIEDGQLALQSLNGLQSGNLRVGVITTYTHALLPQAILAFNSRYPGIHLQIEDMPATRIADQVMSGALDLGLAFTVAESPGLEAEPLFSERLVLLVGPNHPLAERKSVQGKDLATLDMALQSKQYASRQLIDRDLIRYFRGNVRIELDSVQTMQMIVAQSNLACILFEGAVLPLPGLRAIPITSPKVVRTAALLWARDRFRSAASEEFAREVRKSVAERGAPLMQ